MRYFAPREWPPPACCPPPADEWTPPQFWTPRRGGAPIPPTGEGYVVMGYDTGVSGPNDASTEELHQSEQVVKRMLAVWARAVQEDAHSYYQAAMRAAWTDEAIDDPGPYGPDERDLARALEQVWVRGYKIVMSVYQMERWARVHQRLLTGHDEPPDAALRALRNTVEHLDETNLDAFFARPNVTKKKSNQSATCRGRNYF